MKFLVLLAAILIIVQAARVHETNFKYIQEDEDAEESTGAMSMVEMNEVLRTQAKEIAKMKAELKGISDWFKKAKNWIHGLF